MASDVQKISTRTDQAHIFQWMAQGRLEFDRSGFRAVCSREGLLRQAEGRPRVYGVKSFEHPIDRLEEHCHKVLNLIPTFDERHIRSDDDWESTLYPALKTFLLAAAQDQPGVRLVLDAHVTLAFAAGLSLTSSAAAGWNWSNGRRPGGLGRRTMLRLTQRGRRS